MAVLVMIDHFFKQKKMAVPQGFEPQLNGPKPLVLPLHHGTAYNFIYSFKNGSPVRSRTSAK